MVWYITLFPWMMWERISTMGVDNRFNLLWGHSQQIGHSIKHAFSPGFITLFVTLFLWIKTFPTEQNWDVVSLKFCCLVHIKLILNFELKTTTFVNAIGEEKRTRKDFHSKITRKSCHSTTKGGSWPTG